MFVKSVICNGGCVVLYAIQEGFNEWFSPNLSAYLLFKQLERIELLFNLSLDCLYCIVTFLGFVFIFRVHIAVFVYLNVAFY